MFLSAVVLLVKPFAIHSFLFKVAGDGHMYVKTVCFLDDSWCPYQYRVQTVGSKCRIQSRERQRLRALRIADKLRSTSWECSSAASYKAVSPSEPS